MEVKRICVIGAGTMGTGIAQLAARTGYEVSLRDIEDRFVQAGLNTIKESLKKFFVDKGKMTQEEAGKVLGRIKGIVDLKRAVTGAQVVIEAIPEVMELKQQLLRELDELCAPETILASNTSTFSITAIGSLTKRQDKVIGMHFFHPVAAMRLVEIVRGAKTSDETCGTITNLSSKFGKETIVINDSPGFVSTRLYVVLCNEAARLLYEGVANAESIDKACELGLGHAMGPLRSMDFGNGMATSVHCLEYLRSELGDDYRPCPLIRKKALAGELGMKTGKGFYDYGQQGDTSSR